MKILFLCTGNTCRSPMALGFALRWAISRGVDVDLYSAGTLPGGNPATPEGVKVMAEHGIDTSSHVSTNILLALAARPDLIVAMATNHVTETVGIDPELWSRTFTLKELARRTTEAGPRRAEEPLAAYLHRCADGRRPAALASVLPSRDDIEDPIGRGLAAYRRCADEIESLFLATFERLFPQDH